MRPDSKADVDDVPRWALWLVAVVCFGPLTLMWLLGLLYVWFWVAMIAVRLAEPERFAQDPSVAIWDVAWPVGWWVTGGLIGLVGLVRVLTLSRRERPKSHRVFTIGMVTVGLTTLLIFDLPMIADPTPAFSDALSLVGPVVYAVLPFTGAAWLLAKSWTFLLAASVRPGVESRGSTIRRERRDDWRLDA